MVFNRAQIVVHGGVRDLVKRFFISIILQLLTRLIYWARVKL